MAESSDHFTHSTPALYDRFMGPLLFEPYAKIVAERARLLRPDRILETAAGTGIVTRALHAALPQANIVATDVSAVMLEVAARRLASERVAFRPADAQALPFADDSFDLVVCQFGAMFFPDRIRAHAEARRVLRADGHYLLVVFDRLERNPGTEGSRTGGRRDVPGQSVDVHGARSIQLRGTRNHRAEFARGGLRSYRVRDRRRQQPGRRTGRRSRDGARFAAACRDRASRQCRPGTGSQCGRGCGGTVGRSRRADVRSLRDRDQVDANGPKRRYLHTFHGDTIRVTVRLRRHCSPKSHLALTFPWPPAPPRSRLRSAEDIHGEGHR